LGAPKRCLVAICHNGPVVFSSTVKSLMELGWGNRVDHAKQAHGFDAIDFMWSDRFPRVDALRDEAVTFAQYDGYDRKGRKHTPYTHLLFLDADMTWPSDVLERMLRHHDKGIVSGLYFLKGGDWAPVALRDGQIPEGSSTRQYMRDRAYLETGTDLRPEEAVGMGCTLIPMDVFGKIGPRPWFDYANDDEGWPLVSEDVTFCQKAAAAGFGIWMDPTVKCGHSTIYTVTEKWFKSIVTEQSGVTVQTSERVIPPPSDHWDVAGVVAAG
jgi:GT2 family glycosyltransferase